MPKPRLIYLIELDDNGEMLKTENEFCPTGLKTRQIDIFDKDDVLLKNGPSWTQNKLRKIKCEVINLVNPSPITAVALARRPKPFKTQTVPPLYW